MQYRRHAIKLSLFFFLLLFLAGRIGLFLHEFLGHALAWRLLGGRLTGFSLFIFGGGRVKFSQSPSQIDLSTMQQLAVQLSGIGVELAVGTILMILATFWSSSRSFRALLVSASGVLIVHAFFYLTVGMYYGSGDGQLLFKLLQGGLRQIFIFITFGMTVVSAFLISYQFAPTVKSWWGDGSLKKGSWIIILCACSAVLLHGLLTYGERIVVNDPVYDKIKSSAKERQKAAELSKLIADYLAQHGIPPDKVQMQNLEQTLKKKYWQFPLDIILGIGILAGSLLGYLKARRKEFENSNPITWKDIIPLGSTSVLVAGLIIILNWV